MATLKRVDLNSHTPANKALVYIDFFRGNQ